MNIAALPPLRDFFDALLKTVAAVALLYVLLGFLVDVVAPRIPLTTEIALGRSFETAFAKDALPGQDEQLQRVLDNLLRHAGPLPAFTYRVHVKKSKSINALALPGGNILVLDALLKELDSENELAMVLGHELGHFYYRDHLKGLGRQLIFLLCSTVFFGADSPTSKFFSNSLTNIEMRFSQSQEMAADLYALEVAERAYGHAGGAVDFLAKMARKEKLPGFFYLFASHPYPQKRVLALKSAIVARKYALGEKIPFSYSYEAAPVVR